jgi:3D (Asp-Asp-Asp) domain-containing protein
MKKYIIIIILLSGAIAVLSAPKTYTIENTRPEPEPEAVKTEPARIVKAKITQYTLLGTMASGKQVYDGAIACPRAIKLGTRVEIDGIEYICEDRLSVKYDNRFDIWQQDYETAITWGIREKEVVIK